MQFTADTIAGFLSGEIEGSKDAAVWTISKIEEGKKGSLCFLSNPKYEPYIYTTEASIVIVNKSFKPSHPVKATLIKVDDAYSCFAKLLEMYDSAKPQKVGVSDRSSIDSSAKLGEGCYVGDFAYIGENVVIGNGVKIYPHVWIDDNVTIGDNTTLYASVKVYSMSCIGSDVTIHAGAVIGADGFGFAPNENGVFRKIPQIGNVIIEDGVDIGANTCVDRATMGSTIIRKGVKLDNLIQVGHNVSIGENTAIAAQTGIAGSTKIGANCMFGGQVGIAGHLELGNYIKLASKAGVSNSISDNLTHMGYPSMPATRFSRSNAVFRNLPELSGKVYQLEKDVAKLKKECDK